MTMNTMHIGLDDTDSPRKGCTTYVAALLVERLLELGVTFIDYPNLIRLNPNVPWKTRGNGALCLRIKYARNLRDEIRETVVATVENESDLEHRDTDPGMVFLDHATVPRQVRLFAKEATTGIVTLRQALGLLRRHRGEALGFREGRGIIGALAAIGETLEGDHTYEIIVYRVPENLGTKRRVDEASVFQMDKATAPYTFNNVDFEKRRIIITPRGPDPILFGIRGEDSETVRRAFKMVKSLEPVDRWVIFRTNHGTDAHLKEIEKLDQIKPYSPVVARGTVASNPKIVPRRHVIFSLKDESGEVDCAAYEPTGALRQFAMKLIVGDNIEVSGGVREASQTHLLTINLEKVRLLKMAPRIFYSNPTCPNCGKRLESAGKDKGFKCAKCGFKTAQLKKVETLLRRDIAEGLYIASTRSQRHLTKPLRRYGLEKRNDRIGEPFGQWHSP